MATIGEIYSQIGKLLADANAKTGMSDETLTDAIATLIAGYGTTPEEIGINLENVVEWYHSELRDALSYVDALGSEDWVHHLVIADTHYNINYRHSMAMMVALDGTGLFDRAIHLGDITELSTDASARQNLIDDGWGMLSNKAIVCVGNHDGKATTTEMPLSSYKDAMMGDNLDNVYNPNDANYSSFYYDDVSRKIRYIVVYYSFATDQMTWMSEKIAELEEGWTYFILTHYPSLPCKTNANDVQALNGWLRIQTLADPHRGTQFGGIICGHTHVDDLSHTDLLAQATLTCDRYLFGNENPDDYMPHPREEGTTSEQAITIWSINTKEKKCKFYRIGATTIKYGRQFEYNMHIIEPNKVYENGGWVGTVMPVCTFVGGVVDKTAYLSKMIRWTEDSSKGTIFAKRNDGKSLQKVVIAFFNDSNFTSFVGRQGANMTKTTDILKFKYEKYFHNLWYVNQNASKWRTELYGLVAYEMSSDEYMGAFENESNVLEVYTQDELPILDYPYDPTTWYENAGINGAGSPDSSWTSAYHCNTLVTVEPNTTYKIYAEDGVQITDTYVAQFGFPCEYTASQGYCQGFIRRDRKTPSNNVATFTTTADTHYVAFCVQTDFENVSKVKFEKVV